MRGNLSSLPPLLLASLAQGLALLLVWLLAPLWPEMPVLRLLLQGGLAALTGWLLRLPPWWLPINLMLPLAVVTTLSWQLPPWLFLLAFFLLALVQWNSAPERVPLYLTNRHTCEALERLLPQGEVHFADLGSGLGGTLFHLARRRPEARFTGIESAPLPFLIAWCRLKLSGLKNLQLRYGSFWKEDLGEFNVVYAFLSPVPMARLFAKVETEMPAGGLFISNSFEVPSRPADSLITLADRRRTRLYCWRLNDPAV